MTGQNGFNMDFFISAEDEELDEDIDFDMNDFQLMSEDKEETQPRIMHPKVQRSAVYMKLKYDNAVHLAKDIDLGRNARTTCIVSGNFVFGDILGALTKERCIRVKELYISTLSLNEANIDTIAEMTKDSHTEHIHMFLSGFFYSHEKNGIVPYMYSRLDRGNKFQVSFPNTHMKVVLMETWNGMYYVLHGSANLRSSSCLEQFDFEESRELYQFYQKAFDNLERKYATIDFTKPVTPNSKKALNAMRGE